MPPEPRMFTRHEGDQNGKKEKEKEKITDIQTPRCNRGVFENFLVYFEPWSIIWVKEIKIKKEEL